MINSIIINYNDDKYNLQILNNFSLKTVESDLTEIKRNLNEIIFFRVYRGE